MALVICSQCSGSVADNAPYCPHCGAPREAKEFSFGDFLRHLQGMNTAQTNLPLFLGAALGVLAVLGLHLVLSTPGTPLDFVSITWQTALGALVGCLLGAMVRRKGG